MTGTADADDLNGLGGDDQIEGRGGNDRLDGGEGNDRVDGNEGNDTIYGGDGNDGVYGQEGNDTLFGGAGNDQLSGGEGVNTAWGGDGSDSFSTSFGATDTLHGEAGNDYISISYGTVTFDGGADQDSLRADFRNYTNSIYNPITESVRMDLRGPVWTYSIGAVSGSLSNMELGQYIWTGWGDDVIRLGTAGFTVDTSVGNDEVYGGDGNDDLTGAEGDDTLRGGGGNDTLHGGGGVGWDPGSNQLFGDAGDDLLIVSSAGDRLDGGTGTDRAAFGGMRLSNYRLEKVGDVWTITLTQFANWQHWIPEGSSWELRNIERLVIGGQTVTLGGAIFTDFGDVIRFDARDPAQNPGDYTGGKHLNALGGDDIVYLPTSSAGYASHQLTDAVFNAGAGNDTVNGGVLRDQIRGGADNDSLRGGAGNDDLRGEAGDDLLEGGADNDYLDGGDGIDTINFSGAATWVSVNLQLGTATGSSIGTDTIVGVEDIQGSAHDDRLVGSVAINAMDGAGGHDQLEGSIGADVLNGGAGDDVLVGGTFGGGDTAVDTLIGGGGSDTYIVDHGDIVQGLSSNDIGALYRGQNAALLAVIGDGTDLQVRSYGAGFSSYESFQIQFAQAGGHLMAENAALSGVSGVHLTFVGNPVGSVLSRVAFDRAQALASLADRVDSFHQTIDTLFGGGRGDGPAQAPAEDPGPQTITVDQVLAGAIMVSMVLALKKHILSAAHWAIRQVRKSPDESGSVAAAVDSSSGDLFGVVEDFRLTGDTLLWQSMRPDALRNDDQAVETISAMFDNGTGLEASRAGHLVLTAALDYQLGFIERAAVEQINSLMDAINGGSNAPVAPDGSQAAGPHNAPSDQPDIVVARVGQAAYAGLGGDDFFLGDGIERRLNEPGGAGVSHTFDGGAGVDSLTYGFDTAGVIVDLAAGTASGTFIGSDTLISIESAYGGSGHDIIRGSAVDNELVGAVGDDLLDGRGGADFLDGFDGDDRLIGGDGQDRLMGGDGADTLEGGAGDDVVNGGHGTDTAVFAGASSNYTWVRQADGSWLVTDNRAAGGTGVDRLTDVEQLQFSDRLVRLNVISGTANADVLNGTANDDELVGLAGNDTLNGLAGNDLLIGGAGADTLNGGDGTDRVSYLGSSAGVTARLGAGANGGGDAQGDVLSSIENLTGSAFNDILFGSAGVNVLEGGDGNDVLSGGLGADTLNGGAGTDRVTYSASSAGVTARLDGVTSSGGEAQGDLLVGIENITGSAFNDILIGVAGANFLQGLDGDDALNGGAGADTLDGGVGFDRVSYSTSASAVNARLQGGASTGGDAEGDILISIESLTGTAFDDTLAGSVSANYLNGYDGDDILNGGAGADTIDGGSGIDRVTYATSTSAVVARLDGGANSGGDAAGDLLVRVENLTGTSYNDTLIGSSGANNILGGGGNDVISGGAGADTLDGMTGTDRVSYSTSSAGVTARLDGGANTGGDAQGDILLNIESITGSAHNDTLIGAAGVNHLAGLNGEDALIGGTGADTLDGGAGVDSVSYTGSAAAVTIRLGGGGNTGGDAQGDVLISIENVTGSTFNDILIGSTAANLLAGGDGNDTLNGGLGADTLNGGAGVDRATYSTSSAAVTVRLDGGVSTGGDAQGDTLIGIEDVTGSAHNDVLIGSTGANYLIGLNGADSLTGGGGDDLLYGGAGADLFIFAGASGTDRIVDFGVSAGDVIRLDSSLFSGFADVMSHTSDAPGGVVISKGGVQITLTGVTKAQLSAGDFQFAAAATLEVSKPMSPQTLPGPMDGDSLVLPGLQADKLLVADEDAIICPPSRDDGAKTMTVDPLDPLVLPPDLEPKPSSDEGPVICQPGNEGPPSARPVWDLAEMGLLDFDGRDPHRVLLEPRGSDWMV